MESYLVNGSLYFFKNVLYVLLYYSSAFLIFWFAGMSIIYLLNVQQQPHAYLIVTLVLLQWAV